MTLTFKNNQKLVYYHDSFALEKQKILWLDTTEKNLDSHKKQRCSLNSIKICSCFEECEEYIRNNTQYCFTLIVTGDETSETIKNLNKLETVTAIYLRCYENTTDQRGIAELRKVS